MSFQVNLYQGGTGSSTAAGARSNLGLTWIRADLSDQCDGIVEIFLLATPFVAGTLEVWVNGQYQGISPKHFEELPGALSFRFGDFILVADDELVVRYMLQSE